MSNVESDIFEIIADKAAVETLSTWGRLLELPLALREKGISHEAWLLGDERCR